MKFIYQNPRTQALLQEWAEERFEAALGGRSPSKDPTLPEVKRALKHLITGKAKSKFFICIDGLDEFDPEISQTNVQSLIDLTRLPTQYENIKVLLSSRPLCEFEYGYRGYPSLRIQDLTRDDIRRYSTVKLMQHPRMQVLEKKEPERTKEMLHSIVDASSGVFLWVRLVTESLLTGLTNHDSIQDLKKRLDDLPSDLQNLYETLLSRIDSNYRNLWFAMEADSAMVYRTNVAPLSDEEVDERVSEMEGRVKNLCKGLAEVLSPSDDSFLGMRYINHPTHYDPSTKSRALSAAVIHRSVYEFLHRPDIRDKFIDNFLPQTFDSGLATLRSGVLLIKTCRLKASTDWHVLIGLFGAVGWRAGLKGDFRRGGKKAHDYLRLIDGLDRSAQCLIPMVHEAAKSTEHLAQYRTPLSVPDGARIGGNEYFSLLRKAIPDQSYHWSAWVHYSGLMSSSHRVYYFRSLLYDKQASILSFAAATRLDDYLRSHLEKGGPDVLKSGSYPLLLACIRVPILGTEIGSGTTIQLLLEHHMVPAGADPNGYVLWNTNALNRLKVDLTQIIDNLWGINVPSYKKMSEGFDQRLQAVIRALKERGAVEKEWKDQESVRNFIREVNEKLALHGSGAKVEETTEDDEATLTRPAVKAPEDATSAQGHVNADGDLHDKSIGNADISDTIEGTTCKGGRLTEASAEEQEKKDEEGEVGNRNMDRIADVSVGEVARLEGQGTSLSVNASKEEEDKGVEAKQEEKEREEEKEDGVADVSVNEDGRLAEKGTSPSTSASTDPKEEEENEENEMDKEKVGEAARLEEEGTSSSVSPTKEAKEGEETKKQETEKAGEVSSGNVDGVARLAEQGTSLSISASKEEKEEDAGKQERRSSTNTEPTIINEDDVKRADMTTPKALESITTPAKKSRVRRWCGKIARAIRRAV
ncbi:hypothetical protein F5Y17DRAFT_460553 [Xylariaceae sp. FL0594]|nr:hypothetical protein F5Y17DRAFT_460553 [Xylariaceae sp. FL0594]